jgi:hypothetical protein
MADTALLPLDSLNCVLGYLETELTLHEKANDDRRFDAVFEHASRLREWLSGFDDGETDAAILAENADGAEAHVSSETPSS